MKLVVLILLFSSLGVSANHPNTKYLRDLFEQASVNEVANNELFSLTQSYSLTTFPLYYAYNAAAEMTRANHTVWPTSKLNHFNTGKFRLEEAVKYAPKNVEIRYIRYCIQKNCPSFLNYSDNLQEDRKFILDNINQSDWSENYKVKIKEFLK